MLEIGSHGGFDAGGKALGAKLGNCFAGFSPTITLRVLMLSQKAVIL